MSLLLSWAPFGDGITVAAGVMRTSFPLFFALVALAKTGRYVALALITAGVIGAADPGPDTAASQPAVPAPGASAE